MYLAIMVLVAAAGITRLYLQQRRERLSVEKADGFWAGLERIAVHPDPRATAPIKRRERTARPKMFGGRARATGIDPARRAAAKRRIEQRRRIVAQRAAARRVAEARRQAAARARSSRRAKGRQVARQTPAARRSAARSGAPRQRQPQARVPEAYEVPPARRDLQPGRLVKQRAAQSGGSPRSARRRVATPPPRKKHLEPIPRPVLIPDASDLPRIMVRNVEPRRIDIDDRHADWIDLREATFGRYVR
ncbi:MAG: hypothetical protein GEU78_06995 [Actinobacteria bacterium]|nr:hypothetical protein [Actinomycetota bacterium]